MDSQTKFVGEYYEVTTTETTKHYSIGGQRVAVRENGTLTYLLGDHLGGTSAIVNTSGQKVAENWYLPFGEVRYTSGTLPTGNTFTGQFDNTADFGWMYYKARWYDPPSTIAEREFTDRESKHHLILSAQLIQIRYK